MFENNRDKKNGWFSVNPPKPDIQKKWFSVKPPKENN